MRGVLALTLLLLLVLPAAASAVTVRGTVTNHAGQPIEYATVAAPALKLGTATDEQGRFDLELPPGAVVLQVSQLGYEPARVQVEVAPGMAPLRVTLADQPVELAEVTVEASSFGKTGKAEGPVLRRIDVWMTPGGAADVFQSLRALPGTNAPAEGAAVYVRGGDPGETLVRLDGSDVGHPYHYERASGGLFSTLDPYMVKSAFFSSGGFSAKYGGALSGVLDVETEDPLNLKTFTLGANLAGVTGSTSWALVPDRLSFIGSLRVQIPDVLFRLYGSSQEYETAPVSRDAAARLLYRYSSTGRLAATWLGSGEAVRVRARYLNFEGRYTDDTRTDFGSLRVQDVLAGRLAFHGQLSVQSYRTGWTYGSIDARQREHNLQGDLEAVCPLSPRHELSFGAIWRHRETNISGVFPEDSTDLAPGAPLRQYDTRPVLDYPGFYLEDKLRLWGPIYATLGARADWLSTPGLWTVDPRGALAWRLDDRQTLRVAAGEYHQPANPRYLDPAYGNPDLEPLEARHVVAGYEWKSESSNLRAEAYRKEYRRLVTNDLTCFYSNDGFGYARGVDLFMQKTFFTCSGWISYGYLDTRRKELDDPRELPASYGVRHTLTLVGQYRLSSRWQVGSRFGYSSGRPYTPVVARVWDAARGVWHPVFGENDSGLLPEYRRLDLRLTRFFNPPRVLGLRPGSTCVGYVEGMNVLGIRNVLEYEWNADFSVRTARDSYFARRMLVAGFMLTW